MRPEVQEILDKINKLLPEVLQKLERPDEATEKEAQEKVLDSTTQMG